MRSVRLTPITVRRQVPKNVTKKGQQIGRNGSKTAAMDFSGFPCASLGSSTVKLLDSLRNGRACACSEAGFSSQNGDRA
jgi:hypothetical protein